MIERDWMEYITRRRVQAISKVVPESILLHAIDMIEAMGQTGDYRNRMIEFLYQGSQETNIGYICCCSPSDMYEIHHEFLLLLEGWIWKLTASNGDIERDEIKAYHMKASV